MKIFLVTINLISLFFINNLCCTAFKHLGLNYFIKNVKEGKIVLHLRGFKKVV